MVIARTEHTHAHKATEDWNDGTPVAMTHTVAANRPDPGRSATALAQPPSGPPIPWLGAEPTQATSHGLSLLLAQPNGPHWGRAAGPHLCMYVYTGASS